MKTLVQPNLSKIYLRTSGVKMLNLSDESAEDTQPPVDFLDPSPPFRKKSASLRTDAQQVWHFELWGFQRFPKVIECEVKQI